MTREAYRRIVRSFADRSIAVIGDVMLDEYLFGRAGRVSPEAPVMVIEVEREGAVPGGAANVACNLLALGARVAVAGVVGDDDAGRSLATLLSERGADLAGLVVDPVRPTTRKTRVLAQSQQVLRVDRESSGELAPATQEALIRQLDALIPSVDAVLISDYDKGALSGGVAARAVDAGHRAGKLVAANPKPVHGADLRGADVLSFNESEAASALQLLGHSRLSSALRGDAEGIGAAGAALRSELGVRHLVVTRGARGLSVWGEDGTEHHIPARPVEVYDVAGAGDTMIAALTLGMAAGVPVRDAAVVANHAAACVVRKVGVATVSVDELLADW